MVAESDVGAAPYPYQTRRGAALAHLDECAEHGLVQQVVDRLAQAVSEGRADCDHDLVRPAAGLGVAGVDEQRRPVGCRRGEERGSRTCGSACSAPGRRRAPSVPGPA